MLNDAVRFCPQMGVTVGVTRTLNKVTVRAGTMYTHVHMKSIYHMGTNFCGRFNFTVFESTSQTAKNNSGEFSARICLRKNTPCHWARQAREWCPLVTFVQPLTTIIRKGRGDYTQNKSVKTKTFENFIIKMLWQNTKFNPTKICTRMV